MRFPQPSSNTASVSLWHVALLLLCTLIATNSCTEPPDPALVEALTAGLWHASVGGDDYIYEFTFRNEALGGRLHMVTRGSGSRGRHHTQDRG